MIEVTGIDLVKLAQRAYDLSVPQGMGFLHFTPEPLSEQVAKDYIHLDTHYLRVLDMDYVNGRAVKFHVRREKDGKLFISDSWYDHTDGAYRKLLEPFGIKIPSPAEHGCACNCINCQSKR